MVNKLPRLDKVIFTNEEQAAFVSLRIACERSFIWTLQEKYEGHALEDSCFLRAGCHKWPDFKSAFKHYADKYARKSSPYYTTRDLLEIRRNAIARLKFMQDVYKRKTKLKITIKYPQEGNKERVAR